MYENNKFLFCLAFPIFIINVYKSNNRIYWFDVFYITDILKIDSRISSIYKIKLYW